MLLIESNLEVETELTKVQLTVNWQNEGANLRRRLPKRYSWLRAQQLQLTNVPCHLP